MPQQSSLKPCLQWAGITLCQDVVSLYSEQCLSYCCLAEKEQHVLSSLPSSLDIFKSLTVRRLHGHVSVPCHVALVRKSESPRKSALVPGRPFTWDPSKGICLSLRQCFWVDGIKRMSLLGHRKTKQTSTFSLYSDRTCWFCIFPLQSPTCSVLCTINSIWIVNTKFFNNFYI